MSKSRENRRRRARRRKKLEWRHGALQRALAALPGFIKKDTLISIGTKGRVRTITGVTSQGLFAGKADT